MDYMISKYLYALKRGAFKRFGHHHPPHFSYGDWFETYIRQSMPNLGEKVRGLFDYDTMLESLEQGIKGKDEKAWHRHTSLIMINDMIRCYNL